MKGLSCIISALNEGPRIANVLKSVYDHPLIDEVIVVDDGSTDNTSEVSKRFRNVKVIRHEINKGKTRSMIDGCQKSKNNLVMFLDADLIDLSKKNISNLVKPVLDGLVDMSIGMVKHDSRFYIIATIIGHGAYSGQRAMRKEIAIKTLKKVHGYGAEAIINQYVLDNNLKFIVVNWLNVKASLRFKEVGIVKSFISLIRTFKEIFYVVPPLKFFSQLLKMRKLSKKYKKDIKKRP